MGTETDPIRKRPGARSLHERIIQRSGPRLAAESMPSMGSRATPASEATEHARGGVDRLDQSQDSAGPPVAQRPAFLAIFPSIMLPMFLAVVDQTIVATALPAIAASLGNVERISWVVVAYLLAGTIAAPVYGQLRDVYGGRRMMFAALGIFLAASLFCALAT